MARRVVDHLSLVPNHLREGSDAARPARPCQGLIVLLALALTGFLPATTLGSHDPEHPFAGRWTTSYPEAPVSGEIEFLLVTDGTGEAQAAAAGLGASCDPTADYYRGTFKRGTDTGTHIGCRTGSGTTLIGRFHSDGFNVNGGFTLSVEGTTWAGNYYLDDGGGFGLWSGTFADHVAGDGANAAAAPECPTPVKRAGLRATPLARDPIARYGPIAVYRRVPGLRIVHQGRGWVIKGIAVAHLRDSFSWDDCGGVGEIV
jgi:hypothetical protein